MTESLPLGWLYLPVAFVLGALHALEPGHGKSLAAAYLVAGEHDRKDAVVLGVATTLSHTAVVFLLAACALALRNFFPEAALENGIAMAGAAILLVMGSWVALGAIQDLRHGHSHGHDHGYGHSHGHSHTPSAGQSHAKGFWGVALLGLSNGVLPCPGALAALLVAVSMGRPALGLVTVLTYSLGLAAALAAMGVAVVEAGRKLRSLPASDATLRWAPLASGMLVAGTGLFLMLRLWFAKV
ncbi:MAG TPA: sulfite exporter TauE/SafE family protein [bacterium]|jgi:nickel/cobalt exporter|nr:sulfite exporter TauE/SafE family protein [bacterium]